MEILNLEIWKFAEIFQNLEPNIDLLLGVLLPSDIVFHPLTLTSCLHFRKILSQQHVRHVQHDSDEEIMCRWIELPLFHFQISKGVFRKQLIVGSLLRKLHLLAKGFTVICFAFFIPLLVFNWHWSKINKIFLNGPCGKWRFGHRL